MSFCVYLGYVNIIANRILIISAVIVKITGIGLVCCNGVLIIWLFVCFKCIYAIILDNIFNMLLCSLFDIAGLPEHLIKKLLNTKQNLYFYIYFYILLY